MQYSFGGTRRGERPWGDGSRDAEVQANKVVKLCFRIVWSCIASHISFSIENPITSILWKLPEFIDVVGLEFASHCDLDLCSYNLCFPKFLLTPAVCRNDAQTWLHSEARVFRVTWREAFAHVAPCGVLHATFFAVLA